MLRDALPVPYFHLVFTLPHALSRLILANRRAIYTLLFRSAWAALRELAADPKHLGARVGAVMVLHTWGQNLQHHPHVHAVVPGGGLSEDGTRWVPSGSPKYFLPYATLSRLFRDKFLAGLKRLYRQRSQKPGQKQHSTQDWIQGNPPAPKLGGLKLRGKLAPLAEPEAWEQFLAPLAEQDWVVHLQSAPAGCEGPQAVLKYLARYVSGAAISDRRWLSHEDGVANRTTRLARCRELLAASGTVAPPSSAPVEPAAEWAPACPRCQVGRLRLIYREDPPSWSEILNRSPYTYRRAPPRPQAAASPARAADPENTS
jgi:hypothetical protein